MPISELEQRLVVGLLREAVARCGLGDVNDRSLGPLVSLLAAMVEAAEHEADGEHVVVFQDGHISEYLLRDAEGELLDSVAFRPDGEPIRLRSCADELTWPDLWPTEGPASTPDDAAREPGPALTADQSTEPSAVNDCGDTRQNAPRGTAAAIAEGLGVVARSAACGRFAEARNILRAIAAIAWILLKRAAYRWWFDHFWKRER